MTGGALALDITFTLSMSTCAERLADAKKKKKSHGRCHSHDHCAASGA
jgi:hypothetical protein